MLNKNKKEIKDLLDKSYRECFPYLPPVRLDICITTACDTNCAYCWHQEKSASKLTFEAIARIIDLLCSQKPPKLNLTGGEPTVYPDFERVLAYAHSSGIRDILLCTNGCRFQDFSFAEKVINLGVSALNVSVDTLDAEKFEKLRGFKFSVMQKTLENLSCLKKKYPHINITLASVIAKGVTPEDLFSVSAFAKKNGFGYFAQSFLRTAYGSVNNTFDLSEEQRRAFKEKLNWLDGRVAQVVKREGNPLTEKEKRLPCYKGITTVKLSSDGSVGFCWTSKPIGNILRDSFSDIWFSPEAAKMRKYIRDGMCKCDFDCDVYESIELYEDV